MADHLIPRGPSLPVVGFKTPGPPGITLRVCEGLSLTLVAARKHASADLAASIEAALALPLPTTPRFVENGAMRALWAGPGQWLITSRGLSRADAAEKLAAACHGRAALTDQTDGRFIIRIAGPAAEAALQKDAPIDLHPAQFGVGAVALTRMGLMHVMLWRTAPETFELAVASSYAQSLWRMALQSAAGFGVSIAPPLQDGG